MAGIGWLEKASLPKTNPSSADAAFGREPIACNFRTALASYFAHESHEVTLGIPKIRKPQIMIRHTGDHVWLAFHFYPALDQSRISCLNVCNLKIKDRRRMIEFRPFGRCQHQPNSAAVEERKMSGREQKFQPENVAVEFNRAVGVVHVNGDLADLGDGDTAGSSTGCHGFTAPRY